MTPFMVMTIFRTSLMYAIVTFTSESLFSYCSMTVFNSKANVLTFLDEPEIFFSYNLISSSLFSPSFELWILPSFSSKISNRKLLNKNPNLGSETHPFLGVVSNSSINESIDCFIPSVRDGRLPKIKESIYSLQLD